MPQTFAIASFGAQFSIDNVQLTADVPTILLVDPISFPAGGGSSSVTASREMGTLNFGTRLVNSGTFTGNIAVENVLPAGSVDVDFDPVAGPFNRQGFLSTNIAAPGGTANRNYEFTPTTRGNFSTFAEIVDQASATDLLSVELIGRAVAPEVVDADGTSVGAGNVRVGTSGNSTITVENRGDGSAVGVALMGSAAAGAGEFSGGGAINILGDLNDNGGIPNGDETQVLSYTYTPTGFGFDTQNIALTFSNGSEDGTNSADAGTAVVSGTGVGPTLEASYAGAAATPADGVVTPDPGGPQTIDFGDLMVGDSAAVTITLDNNGSGGDLGGLTDLTLTDPSGVLGEFSVSIQSGDLLIENNADTLELLVEFTPSSGGDFQEFFTIGTDQFAALGQTGLGDQFTFELLGSAEAVPEPATLVVWAMLGLVGIGFFVRRRRK